MSGFPRSIEALSVVRYRTLLPLAAKKRSYGSLYAHLVATAHLYHDAAARRRAADAIQRCLGVDRRSALAIFRRALTTEFVEEADTVYFRHHPHELLQAFSCEGAEIRRGPVIYATLHFGSPVLGYLILRRALERDVLIVARPLDATNPMPEAKRGYATDKMDWVAQVAGRRQLHTDGASVLAARAHLLDGGSLIAAFDVPGDIVARSQTVPFLGSELHLAAGIDVLARATGVPVQPIVTVRSGGTLVIVAAPAVERSDRDARFVAVVDRLAAFVAARPDQWWMWAHLFGRDAAPRGSVNRA